MSRSPNNFVEHELYGKHMEKRYARFANDNASTPTAILQRMFYRQLIELACNRFKWTGLPDSIDVRYLEMTLFRSALSVFWYDYDIPGFQASPATGSGEVDAAGDPIGFKVTKLDRSSATLRAKKDYEIINDELVELAPECVPIWANYLRVPDLDIVAIYSHRLAELERTIDINVKSARVTRVLITDENTRLSGQNIMDQIDKGLPIIPVSRSISDMIESVDLGMHPDHIEKLHVLRARLWNDCMTLLGINNSNQDKKERLVSDEVGANDDQVLSIRQVNLNQRREACLAINKIWPDLNIEVSYYTDPVNSVPDVQGYRNADSNTQV